MKKILALITVSILPLIFTACGLKSDTGSYIGYWQSDANTIFEVLTENGRDFIIHNEYGDLQARIKDGALRGKNSAGEEIFMAVKGDTAFYDNGRMLNGYKRITMEEYYDVKVKKDIDKVLKEVYSE